MNFSRVNLLTGMFIIIKFRFLANDYQKYKFVKNSKYTVKIISHKNINIFTKKEMHKEWEKNGIFRNF